MVKILLGVEGVMIVKIFENTILFVLCLVILSGCFTREELLWVVKFMVLQIVYQVVYLEIIENLLDLQLKIGKLKR